MPAKVTITASDLEEGKAVLVTTEGEDNEANHVLTAENPTVEILTEEVIVTGIEEVDAADYATEKEEEGDEDK